MLSEVAEWLFQNVSKIVVDEAERQIREEAFPILPDSGKKERTNLNPQSEMAGATASRRPHHRALYKMAREMDLVTIVPNL